MTTYQMPEMFLDHQLQSLCCAGSVPRNHGVPCHNLSNRGCMRIKSICSDLSEVNISFTGILQYKNTHPICQILCCENSTEAFLIIHDQNAVCPFCGAKLTGFRHGDILRNGQSSAWF